MTATALQSGFTQEASTAFLRAREPDWLIDLRREAWETFQRAALARAPAGGMDADRHPRLPAGQFRPSRRRLPTMSAVPAAAVDRRRRAGRATTVAARQLTMPVPAGPAIGRARACSSAAWTSLAAEHGELLRPHLLRRASIPATTSSPRCTRPVWSRRHAALRAQGRGDRPAAAHFLGPRRPGGVDLGRTPGGAGRGRRGHAAGRDRQQRPDGRRAALRGGRVARGPAARGCAT